MLEKRYTWYVYFFDSENNLVAGYSDEVPPTRQWLNDEIAFLADCTGDLLIHHEAHKTWHPGMYKRAKEGKLARKG